MVSTITALLTGSIRALGPKGIPSGIDKQPQDRPLRLTRGGFEHDAQGDTKHHGGPDKAVHHYPLDHYVAWREDVGALPLLDRPGAFGENLSTSGVVEADVAVGDRFRVGSALVEISQGRQPCFRLNLRFGVADMARRVQRSGRTGWYYRVIEEGVVTPGDRLALVERISPEWTVERLWRIFYVDTLDRESLSAIAALTHLPERWRTTALDRLRRNAIEDWRPRLDGN